DQALSLPEDQASRARRRGAVVVTSTPIPRIVPPIVAAIVAAGCALVSGNAHRARIDRRPARVRRRARLGAVSRPEEPGHAARVGGGGAGGRVSLGEGGGG